MVADIMIGYYANIQFVSSKNILANNDKLNLGKVTYASILMSVILLL